MQAQILFLFFFTGWFSSSLRTLVHTASAPPLELAAQALQQDCLRPCVCTPPMPALATSPSDFKVPRFLRQPAVHPKPWLKSRLNQCALFALLLAGVVWLITPPADSGRTSTAIAKAPEEVARQLPPPGKHVKEKDPFPDDLAAFAHRFDPEGHSVSTALNPINDEVLCRLRPAESSIIEPQETPPERASIPLPGTTLQRTEFTFLPAVSTTPVPLPAPTSLRELFAGSGYAGYSPRGQAAILFKVQARLNELQTRPVIEADGVLGPKTALAVLAFQQARQTELLATGRLDTPTLRLLNLADEGDKSDWRLPSSNSPATANRPPTKRAPTEPAPPAIELYGSDGPGRDVAEKFARGLLKIRDAMKKKSN